MDRIDPSTLHQHRSHDEHQVWSSGIVLVILTLLMVACAQATPTATPSEPILVPTNADGYVDITVEQLAEMLENQELALVNVHIPYDGELPQTDLSIPFDQIADHLDQLPSQDSAIVLYCRSGNMSATAAETLVSLGYTQVFEVDGGMRAWQAAGYELLDKD